MTSSVQYFQIYKSRLEQIRPLLLQQYRQTHLLDEDEVPLICDYEPETPAFCVGVLWKRSKERPVLIKEKKEPNHHLMLEDESGKIELVGSIQSDRLVHGMVLGVEGTFQTSESFHVTKVWFPGVLASSNIDRVKERTLYVSSLQFGSKEEALASYRALLAYYIQQKHIDRVVVVGDLFVLSSSSSSTNDLLEMWAEADQWLATISSHAYVDILPGPNDLSGCGLPQQAQPLCYFPKASLYPSFQSRPNPCMLNQTLLCSRQVVDTVRRGEFASDNPLDVLEMTLYAQHMCPNAPDLCFTQTRTSKDLLLLTQSPQIVVAGSCEQFATRTLDSCRFYTQPFETASSFSSPITLVCVPKFHTTKQVVLYDETWTPVTFAIQQQE